MNEVLTDTRSAANKGVSRSEPKAPIAAWYNAEGIWCVCWQRAGNVRIEQYQVIIYE